ncbi:hypothetical protein WMW71_10485 [Flavobacterium buctense]|uniref:Uncharacterized protein n=1 Tax=Flavobacterium buctense TaxID=1648146 RepID=A0ABU9E4A0_9FLAO|nr:hypothetical protein [Flavobacterium buctense]
MNNQFIYKGLEKYKQVLEEQCKKRFEVKTIYIDKHFFSNTPEKENDLDKKSQLVKLEIDSIKKNPILYWFSFDENFKGQEVTRNMFLEYSNAIKSKEYIADKEKYKTNPLSYKRAVSAIKDKFLNTETKTLYVGKVKKDFWFRIVTHCGWAPSPKTAGLQLKYWYDLEELPPLKLNYIVFDPIMDDFVSILEIELNKQLNPLIGKK